MKLSLNPSTPLYMACHNDPIKIECDHCMECIDLECDHSHCDAHGNCQCERTDCICLGRPTSQR